jgi:hypothetical protein
LPPPSKLAQLTWASNPAEKLRRSFPDLDEGESRDSYASPVSGAEPCSARVGAMLGRPVNAAVSELFYFLRAFYFVFFSGFWFLVFIFFFTFFLFLKFFNYF